MLAVALLIILLTSITPLTKTNPVVEKCLNSLKYTAEKMTYAEVPKYCRSMSTDILQCLDKRMNKSTPGDLHSRTKVLNDIARQNGSTLIKSHSKLFNIVCVEYDWVHWTDESCFRRMIEKCVVNNVLDCKNIVCDIPKDNLHGKEKQPSNGSTYGAFSKLYSTLIILITYHMTLFAIKAS